MTQASIWRVPAPRVRRGGGHSVIQDNGMMRSATMASSVNGWVFSEVGAGVQPLALIGTAHGLAEWCAVHREQKIVNLIADLPEIYMGLCRYVPGNRYKGLFPLHDSGAAIAKTAAGFAVGGAKTAIGTPDGVAKTAASLGKTIASGYKQVRTIFPGKAKPPKLRGSGHDLYVKISYLPEKNMMKLGEGKVTIEALGAQLFRQIALM
ncbi:hypothetical protein [Oceaniglobus trochenteri]|uniref:hypothetical protein n=1 Tax=Oceaniglobus trochenteri TaxID=2763260 RepID=UPI001CFFE7C3|nr:hypothetical protein [Oceaniglobus trochenteri]